MVIIFFPKNSLYMFNFVEFILFKGGMYASP